MADVKVFDPFRRKPGTSSAEFSHYWITHHAELVKQFRRIRHYVQNMRLDTGTPAFNSDLAATWCDGCAETWHPDLASVAAMATEPLFPDLMDDEGNFIDLARPRHLLTAGELVLDERGFDPLRRGVKVLLFVRKTPELELGDFIAAWTDEGAASYGRRLGVNRHIVNTTIGHLPRASSTGATDETDDRDELGGYDGVRELWWPDQASLHVGLARDPEAAAALFGNEATATERSFALIAHERVILP